MRRIVCVVILMFRRCFLRVVWWSLIGCRKILLLSVCVRKSCVESLRLFKRRLLRLSWSLWFCGFFILK